MEVAQELVQQIRGKDGEQRSKHENNHHEASSVGDEHNKRNFKLPKLTHYKWWLRVSVYIFVLLAGSTSAFLLTRLYFEKGGNSIWMATIVQSAGFPILLPLLFYFAKNPPSSSTSSLSTGKLALFYVVFGLIVAADNLMHSYGLLYIPVSTFSLLCATQLAFNAVTSFFMNSQKFTILILNSVVLLTIAACLLAINSDNEGSRGKVSKGKYFIGFLCTIGASAVYSFLLSLAQFSFEKWIKNESFSTILGMQFYTSLVATCACVVGLFGSGEWKTLHKEMEDYQLGRVSYAMTLAWAAITWQVSSVGLLGLIFEISSLFANVISTLSFPLIPMFAVVFFHDKMNGVKVVCLVLAIWGFISYIYQHYLDDAKPSKIASKTKNDEDVPCTTLEIC